MLGHGKSRERKGDNGSLQNYIHRDLRYIDEVEILCGQKVSQLKNDLVLVKSEW